MVSHSKPQAGTSVNEEFRVFLQIENMVLLERMRGTVTSTQKSSGCGTCTWRGWTGSSLLMPGTIWGHFFSHPRNMYKAASCEIFREKQIKPTFISLARMRLPVSWELKIHGVRRCGAEVRSLLWGWDWFMVANYWLESRNFSEGKDESPKLSSLTTSWGSDISGLMILPFLAEQQLQSLL